MQALPISYSTGLIAGSLASSIVASYAAFCYAERITRSDGESRRWWLTAGAMVLGLGIWTMHFLGMLAVHLPVEVFYSVPEVLLSYALASVGAGVALNLASKPGMNDTSLWLGSVALGSAIGGMHYVGMASMRSCSMQHYSLPLVGLSVVVAVAFSALALQIIFRLRMRESGGELMRVGGAVVMGVGIAAMHYTAMASVRFMPGMVQPSTQNALSVRVLGGLGVGLTTSIVLVGALVTAFLDRVTFRSLSQAHQKLKDAHLELAQAQKTLRDSEQSLREANLQLRELSIRDGLTKLYNRRHFDEIMANEWRRARSAGMSLTLLIMDVDFFKSLNDQYGHAVGDEILQSVANSLRATLDKDDPGSMVARYGGEEFVMVLPGRGMEQARSMGERVRAAVLALGVQNPRSPHGTLTISVGACCGVPVEGATVDTLIRVADGALYRAKGSGRNRVEVTELPASLQGQTQGHMQASSSAPPMRRAGEAEMLLGVHHGGPVAMASEHKGVGRA